MKYGVEIEIRTFFYSNSYLRSKMVITERRVKDNGTLSCTVGLKAVIINLLTFNLLSCSSVNGPVSCSAQSRICSIIF